MYGLGGSDVLYDSETWPYTRRETTPNSSRGSASCTASGKLGSTSIGAQ